MSEEKVELKDFPKILAEDIKRVGKITDDEIILTGIKDKVRIPIIKKKKIKKFDKKEFSKKMQEAIDEVSEKSGIGVEEMTEAIVGKGSVADIKRQKEVENLLRNPNLFEMINKEFEKQITGEEKSRQAIFLSLCSIWVKNTEIPLNTFVSSESSAGKSFVCKKVIKIFPKSLVEYRSKITGETFTYWHTNEDDWDWDGKICYLEDVKQDLLDSATFKVMCSEGSIASVVRNQKLVDLFVKGKPCMLVTTAGTNPSIELLNRFSIVQLDESSKQTREITLNQALEIKDEEYNQKVIDSLNLLSRVSVSVHFAPQIHNYITKHYSWNDVRMRRDFSRLRDLIKCSTALYQHQRKINDKGKLIATSQDYEIARKVINYIQTTTLKGLTHKLKKAYDKCIKEKEFNAKDIHSKYPFVSQKMWYIYLDDLCERGLLTTELRETGDSKKRVTYYLVPKTSSFELPKYEGLKDYITIDTNDTIVTIDTNDTIDNGTNETNETNEVILRDLKQEKQQKIDKKWSKEDLERLEYAKKQEMEVINNE